MRDLAILAIHLIVTVAKLLLHGGARSIVSESLLLTPAIDFESVTGQSTESATDRPHHHQSLRGSDASLAALGDRAEAIHAHGVSPSLGES
jgi:hypothetical protein